MGPWPKVSGAGPDRLPRSWSGSFKTAGVAVGGGEYDKGGFAGVDGDIAENMIVRGGTRHGDGARTSSTSPWFTSMPIR